MFSHLQIGSIGRNREAPRQTATSISYARVFVCCAGAWHMHAHPQARIRTQPRVTAVGSGQAQLRRCSRPPRESSGGAESRARRGRPADACRRRKRVGIRKRKRRAGKGARGGGGVVRRGAGARRTASPPGAGHLRPGPATAVRARRARPTCARTRSSRTTTRACSSTAGRSRGSRRTRSGPTAAAASRWMPLARAMTTRARTAPAPAAEAAAAAEKESLQRAVADAALKILAHAEDVATVSVWQSVLVKTPTSAWMLGRSWATSASFGARKVKVKTGFLYYYL